MTDVNSKQVFSKVVAVNMGAPNTLSIYPNPVSRNLIIRMPLAVTRASLTLYNSAGIAIKQMLRQTITNGVYTLDMQKYPAGLYILQVTDGQAQYQFKVIKQ